MTPLCRCHLDPRAECPLHPTRDVRELSRRQLLCVALFCLGMAALGAWWLFVRDAFDLAVLR